MAIPAVSLVVPSVNTRLTRTIGLRTNPDRQGLYAPGSREFYMSGRRTRLRPAGVLHHSEQHHCPRLSASCGGSGLSMVPLAGAQQDDEQTGIDQGNYNTKQSIEFGYRFTNVKGSQATSDTMVNLQQGPKLLGFTTEFRSLDHRATFFDNLYLSDPNDVSQIRISKNHCYAFNGMFRKDQKLLGLFLAGESPEPLTPVPNAPVNFNPIINAPPNVLETPLIGTSPHSFYTHRNMQNYNLTILPDSKIRFRLGYDQNTVYGPGGGTIHQGTEQYLLRDYS